MTIIQDYLRYKKSHEDLLTSAAQLEAEIAKNLATLLHFQSIIALSEPGSSVDLLENGLENGKTPKELRQIAQLKQTVHSLQQEKKTMEQKWQLERLLLESKVELHKKSLKFLEQPSAGNRGALGAHAHAQHQPHDPLHAPSSNTSNKLISHNVASFSTTPYLQKIQLIKLSRETPTNSNKMFEAASIFTTSTPDGGSGFKHPSATKASQVSTPVDQMYSLKKKNITSPLRLLLQNKTKKNFSNLRSKMFDEDEGDVSSSKEEETTSDRKFRKIKLSTQSRKKHMMSDDEGGEVESDENARSPVLKRLRFGANAKGLSPLKTNNIFKV